MPERLREGLEIARRNYERVDETYFWPDDPDQQAWMIRWLSEIAHEPGWPIGGRKAAYSILQRLADERDTLHPIARVVLRSVAEQALAAGPPKPDGRPSTAWRDKALIDMYRPLRRQGCQRHEAVAWLAKAAGIGKDRVRGILRAAGVD